MHNKALAMGTLFFTWLAVCWLGLQAPLTKGGAVALAMWTIIIIAIFTVVISSESNE